MLQGYLDASGTGDPSAMALAGFIADAETWAAFSTEWKARLDHAGLPAFKMNEMARSEANLERAAFFYRTIEEFDIRAAVSCVVHTADLARVLDETDMPPLAKEKLRNPYYLAFRALIEQISQSQVNMGLNGPIDFILDNQSEKRAIIESWDLLKFAAASQIQPLLGDTPVFRDDDFRNATTSRRLVRVVGFKMA